MARKRRRQKGSGQVRQEVGGTWSIRWTENGRRPFRGGFPTKDVAERALRVIQGGLALERAGLPPDQKLLPTLSVLAEDWLARRQHTHSSWTKDRGRWHLHLAPHFGCMKAPQVDTASVRAFVEAKLREKTISKTTIGLCVRCLSTFFSDLSERPRETGVARNPVAGLPKSLRRLFRSEHDPRFTPYVERLEDVVRIYQALPAPLAVAYAIGACAGLRIGEILALDWPSVDLDDEDPRIDVRAQVQNGRLGPLKDREARILQGDFLAPLLPVLRWWREETGGRGLVIPPHLVRAQGHGSRAKFTRARLCNEGLDDAMDLLEMEPMEWSHATRHTFSTHWLRAGHSLGELALVLGHSSMFVTMRYAHIRPASGKDGDPWKLSLGIAEIGQPQGTGTFGAKTVSAATT